MADQTPQSCPTCALDAEAQRAADSAVTRAVHNAQRGADCPVWHAAVQRLIPYHLIPSSEADRLARGAAALAEGQVIRLRSRLDELFAQHEQQTEHMRSALARCRALVTRKRKTVPMDALRSALDATPTEQPAAEPEPCVITDDAGDELGVASSPCRLRVAITATGSVWLTPDQAEQHARAVLAHTAAVRAAAKAADHG